MTVMVSEVWGYRWTKLVSWPMTFRWFWTGWLQISFRRPHKSWFSTAAEFSFGNRENDFCHTSKLMKTLATRQKSRQHRAKYGDFVTSRSDHLYDPLPQQAEALVRTSGVTAVVVARGDRTIAVWGEASRPLNVRSVRKSLLSALFGAAALDKPINLTTTLAELDIDDRDPALSDQERQATIRDLLMARSGVYHAAAYEPPSMKAKRPSRGSHVPGSFWYYNNWDFNALGAIYERITGEDIYESFEQRIAAQIGMEHFAGSGCRRVFDPASDHPAHTFRISAHDLARFGLLFLNGGQWLGRRVIPASWVKESITAYSQTDHGRLGYGYLWWIAPAGSPFGADAYFALGAGGQGLAVMPEHNLVVAQTVNMQEGGARLGANHFAQLLRQIVASSRKV
jgi:CubicO group peptidase (beta-lactamase class C family)